MSVNDLAKRLEFLRTPNDKLLLGVARNPDIDDLKEVLEVVIPCFHLPMPGGICEVSPEDIKWAIYFEVTPEWWVQMSGVWEWFLEEGEQAPLAI